MKNILDYFEEKHIIFDFKYYGPNDYGSSWSIKTIIDNKDYIFDFFDSIHLEKLEFTEEYYAYLFAEIIKDLEELIPRIADDSNKETMQYLVNVSKEVIKDIGIGEIIKFINKNYTYLFLSELNKYSIPLLTTEYIVKYISGINPDVIDFLITHYKGIIISNFDEFEKWFELNPEYFEKLFSSDELKEYEKLNFDSVLEIWTHIYLKKNTALKDHLETIIPRICEDVKNLARNATVENVIRIESEVRLFNDFLISVRSPLANTFSESYKSIKDLMAEHIKTQGHVFKYEIPVKEMIELWKKQEIWELRLLSSTHEHIIKENGTSYFSRLSSIKTEKHPLLDFVSSNVPTNEFFTLTFQQLLSIRTDVSSALFHYFLFHEEQLLDYISCVKSAVLFVSDSINDNELNDDCEFFANQIEMLANNLQSDENTINMLCYSISMYLCSFAEKILRLFYVYLQKDICYIPIDKATMGQLLTVNNIPLKDVFGEQHIRILSFYFLHDQPNNVGCNIRNSLAHWSNIKKGNLTVSFVARLLFLFTDILNTVFWYFINENRHEILVSHKGLIP